MDIRWGIRNVSGLLDDPKADDIGGAGESEGLEMALVYVAVVSSKSACERRGVREGEGRKLLYSMSKGQWLRKSSKLLSKGVARNR